MNPPFSAGRALSASLSVVFSGAGVFFLMTLLIHVPWLAYTIWLTQRMTTASLMSDTSLHAWIAVAVGAFLHPLAAGAVSYGVLQRLRGKPAALGPSLAAAARHFPSLLGVALLTGLFVLLGALLFVVPGLMLMTQYYVATPVVVVEGKGGMDAIHRSTELTMGSRWHVLALFLIVAVLSIAVSVSVRLVLGSALPPFEAIRLFTLANTGVSVVLEAFSAVVVAVTYHQLRVAREGVDLDSIASAFD